MGIEQLGNSILETINTSEELQRIAIDLGEIALDTGLLEGILQDVPVINTAIGMVKTLSNIKEALFARKLSKFLLQLSDIEPHERSEMIGKLNHSKFQNRAGEELILLLERLDSIDKAELVGKAFHAYIKGSITQTILIRINFAIDRTPIQDLKMLKAIYPESPNNIEHVIQQMYLSAGVIWFEINMGSEGFEWQDEICKPLIDCVLYEI